MRTWYTLALNGRTDFKTSDMYEKVSDVPTLPHNFPNAESDRGIELGRQVEIFYEGIQPVAFIVKRTVK
jgi:hypothetical protein